MWETDFLGIKKQFAQDKWCNVHNNVQYFLQSPT